MAEGNVSKSGLAGHIGGWLALFSTAVTITVTALNTHWTRDAQERAQDLNAQIQQREQALKEQQAALQYQLDTGKEKLARYTFVQNLMAGVLGQNRDQKTLTVNLITLALTPEEAQRFFTGLEVSENKAARDVGVLGSAVTLATLVTQMNDAAKSNRIGAVDQLIKTYRANPAAVDQALKLLEPPQLESLSASGRINVLVFLRNTEGAAWSPEAIQRAEKAIANIRNRKASGVEVGRQTDEALTRLTDFLKALPK